MGLPSAWGTIRKLFHEIQMVFIVSTQCTCDLGLGQQTNASKNFIQMNKANPDGENSWVSLKISDWFDPNQDENDQHKHGLGPQQSCTQNSKISTIILTPTL